MNKEQIKFFKIIEQQLAVEPFSVAGILQKWVVIGKARAADAELIGLLLNNNALKEKFFKKVAGALVFDQTLFVWYLEQKNYLNDSYTQYKNKVGLTVGEKYLKQRNEVALVWPFKDCYLEGGQSREEDKRDEIFFNEALAHDEITQLLQPKVFTNATVHTKDGRSALKTFARNAEINKARNLPADTITDNLLIKGNNLLALHSLKKQFAGKVKLIYIDPPYNTGNDEFKYNDSFTHSTWLTFMKNRLQVAKEMLRDDGVIFVQCDDNEQAYLKVLMDEIFGRENFINSIALKVSPPNGVKISHATKKILKEKEMLLVYKQLSFLIKPQYTAKKEWDKHYSYFVENIDKPINRWKVIKIAEKFKQLNLKPDLENKKFAKFAVDNAKSIMQLVSPPAKIKNDKKYDVPKIQAVDDMNGYFAYEGKQVHFLSKAVKPTIDGIKISNLVCDLWVDIPFNNLFQEGGVALKRGKKPEKLIQRIIDMSTGKGDIVLDYHLGSGTTAAVAHKMGRQYIGIEQLDYIEDKAVTRLNNVIDDEQGGISKAVGWKGGGRFIYFELKKYNQKFMDDIQSAETSRKLLSVWKKMKDRSFLDYNLDIKKQDEHMEEFKRLSLSEQKQHLCEILDKNQLYVNLASLHDRDHACSAAEKKLSADFYQMEK